MFTFNRNPCSLCLGIRSCPGLIEASGGGSVGKGLQSPIRGVPAPASLKLGLQFSIVHEFRLPIRGVPAPASLKRATYFPG